MKIAIDISQICYEGTGVANYTQQLVSSLLRIDKDNEYLLTGIAFRQMFRLEDFYKSLKGISGRVDRKFFYIPQYLGNFLGNRLHFPNLTPYLKNADIFHSSDWIEPKLSLKKVTTVHDLVVLRYPEHSDPLIIKTQKMKLGWVKKESALIFADSFATKNDLIKLLDFESQRITVVYPAADNIFSPTSKKEADRVKNKYGLTDDYVFTVGTLEPRKNLEKTTLAFEGFIRHPLIASLNKPIQLVVVGKRGWGKAAKPVNNVKYLGLVDNIDLPALYSGASLFIYPSLYEGFGLPVLESFSCGCPVISSDGGSLKEVVSDAGLTVDPSSVSEMEINMVKLFIDRDLRKEMVSRGLKRAADFSWNKTGKEIIAGYNKVYGNN